MALRALLFCKNPETADSLAAVLKEAGIRVELCTDIFAAMEKGTKQPFSCVIVDWPEQPEAGFLLKRARESGLNRTATAIAIVDGEPTPDEEREHRLDFLIYRPIVADEARAVLAKACQQMQLHSTALADDAAAVLDHPEMAEPSDPTSEDPNLVSIASELPEAHPQTGSDHASEQSTFDDPVHRQSRSSLPGFRTTLAATLVITAAFCFWRSRDAFLYLRQAPEGAGYVLRESVAALFYVNRPGTLPAGTSMPDAQQDAYFARTPASANSKSAVLSVVSADINLPDAPMHLPPPYDFPLPSPELHVDQAPARPIRAVPDSIRASAPVTRPVVMTVNPAQMMPVSTPPPATSWQQTAEPVHLTEDSARALVMQSVNPVYPPEAMAQKLQGPVVLQVAIGRDGSVLDLKLVRGYFVLGRAAIAAVKQWRFKPYNVNGRALETQTVITINFSYPPG
jgi:TonB family protein